MAPSGKKILRGLRLITIQAIVVLVLLEVALRVLEDRSLGLRRALYMPGVETRYDEARTLRELLAMTPGGFRPLVRNREFILNSRGLKTHEYSDDKTADSKRVVVLGDSFTFASGGVPYVDLWHQSFKEAWAEDARSEVEVISLGVRAVGPDFYRRMWEVEGCRLNADLVVVGFFVGNDFLDVKPSIADAGRIEGLARRSYVVRLARSIWLERGVPENVSPSPRPDAPVRTRGGLIDPELADLPYDPLEPELDAERFRTVHKRRFRIFDRANRGELLESFEVVKTHLDALEEQVHASGSRLVLMLIPNESQVDLELARELAGIWGRDLAAYDLDAPNELLRDWCVAAEVPCLDLAEEFRAAGEGAVLYGARNTHWSAAGNALAGRALFRLVEAQGLLD